MNCPLEKQTKQVIDELLDMQLDGAIVLKSLEIEDGCGTKTIYGVARWGPVFKECAFVVEIHDSPNKVKSHNQNAGKWLT
jgi:hypothetical protein